MKRRGGGRGRARRSKSRTRSRSRGSGGGLRDQNSITRITGRIPVNAGISATAGTVTVTETNLVIANLGDRVVNVGDTFMYWRMVRINYYQVAQTGNISTTVENNGEALLHGAAFVPISNGNYTAPTMIAQLVDFPEYMQRNGLQVVRINVGRSGLIGSMMTKWLTVNTTSDSDVQSAGTLTQVSVSGAASSAATGNLRGLLEFEIEFKEPMDTALIPSMRVHRKGLVTALKPNRVTETTSDGQSRVILDDVKFVTPSAPLVDAHIGVRFEDKKGQTEEKEAHKGWTVLPFSAFGR